MYWIYHLTLVNEKNSQSRSYSTKWSAQHSSAHNVRFNILYTTGSVKSTNCIHKLVSAKSSLYSMSRTFLTVSLVTFKRQAGEKGWGLLSVSDLVLACGYFLEAMHTSLNSVHIENSSRKSLVVHRWWQPPMLLGCNDSKQTGKHEPTFQKEACGRGGNKGRSMNGAKGGDSGSSLSGTAG